MMYNPINRNDSPCFISINTNERRTTMGTTLKKELILNYALATEVEISDFNKNYVILVTPFGLVSGKFLDYDKEVSEDMLVIANTFNKQASENHIKENESINDNDGYLPLKDVKITTSTGLVINMPILNVFYDQVIGVTYGNVDVD